jgi:hypothetical protein
MFDQEVVGPLSARKTKRAPVSSSMTRVELGLVGWTTSVEGVHSWGGAVKVVAAHVSVKVVIKNVRAGAAGVGAMILAILSQTVHRHWTMVEWASLGYRRGEIRIFYSYSWRRRTKSRRRNARAVAALKKWPKVANQPEAEPEEGKKVHSLVGGRC